MPHTRHVRRFAVLFAVLLLGDALLSAALDDWAGSWTATFKGKPYLILKLNSGAGRLSGTLSAGQVEASAQGNVTAIEAPPSDAYPLKSMKLTGNTLSFEVLDADGDTMKYEMRLTPDGAAELRLVDAPVKLGPFALKRN
jgi:hypothetical protein